MFSILESGYFQIEGITGYMTYSSWTPPSCVMRSTTTTTTPSTTPPAIERVRRENSQLKHRIGQILEGENYNYIIFTFQKV